jgi:hypothetical protein
VIPDNGTSKIVRVELETLWKSIRGDMWLVLHLCQYSKPESTFPTLTLIVARLNRCTRLFAEDARFAVETVVIRD